MTRWGMMWRPAAERRSARRCGLGTGLSAVRPAVSVVAISTRGCQPLIVRASVHLSWDRSSRPVRGRKSLRFRPSRALGALQSSLERRTYALTRG